MSEAGPGPTPQDEIQRACHRLMTDPALAPLVAWWEATALRTTMPPGPVDTSRLLMAQGDRERLLWVMRNADAWRQKQESMDVPTPGVPNHLLPRGERKRRRGAAG